MAKEERIYRIIAGVDFSETSERALEEAIRAAGQHREAELHAITVVDDTVASVPVARTHTLQDVVEETREGLRSLVQRLLKPHKGAPPKVFLHVRIGYPGEAVAQLAADVEADLIVVGTHGRRGIKRLMMGSVAERVLRLARCPVLVVRPKLYTQEEGEALEPEPACPDCVARRTATAGAEWWCDDHKDDRELAHRYSYSSRLLPDLPPGHLL